MRAWLAVVVLFGCVPFGLAQTQTSQPEPQLKQRSAAEAHPTGPPEIPGVKCVTFDPAKLTVEEIERGPKLEGGVHWLFGKHELTDLVDSSDPRRIREDLRLVLRIIQYYHMNASCWLHDPLHGFHFMLTEGRAPVTVRASGALVGEECWPYHLRNLRVVEFKTRDRHYSGPNPLFSIEDRPGNVSLYRFASKATAESAFTIVRRFGFTSACDAADLVRGRRFFSYLLAQ